MRDWCVLRYVDYDLKVYSLGDRGVREYGDDTRPRWDWQIFVSSKGAGCLMKMVKNMKNNASLRVRESQRSQTSITPSLGSEPLGSTGPTRNPATLCTDNRVVRASSQTPSTPCSEGCWRRIPTVSTNPVDR